MALTITSKVTLNNGVQMPVFGLGTWRSDAGKVQAAVEKALEDGYVHVDAAYAYENQNEVGAGIKAAIDKGYIKRQDLFVTSKLWQTHHKPEQVKEEIDETLGALGLDYLDQWIMHWPMAWKTPSDGAVYPSNPDGSFDSEDVDYVDAYKAMEEVYESGKVKSIGVSNFNQAELERVLEKCTIKPAVNQIEIHPYFNNEEMHKFCSEKGVHLVAYCPLGNFSPGDADVPCALDDDVIKSIAKAHGKSPAQVIIRWHLQRGVTAIPKSVTASRITENKEVFDFELSQDEFNQITALGVKNHRFCNPPFHKGGRKVFE